MDRRILRHWLARPMAVLQHPRLRWLGPSLRHPRLWHLGRRTVALGTAIGTFMGILVPIGQIPMAMLVAVILRANLPTAVLGTFITNGFTYVPIYALAYWMGCSLTGADAFTQLVGAMHVGGFRDALAMLRVAPHPWTSLLAPLAVGLIVLSVLVAIVTYFAVQGSWAYRVRRAWLQRRSRYARPL